jgi:hypothetical protein
MSYFSLQYFKCILMISFACVITYTYHTVQCFRNGEGMLNGCGCGKSERLKKGGMSHNQALAACDSPL